MPVCATLRTIRSGSSTTTLPRRTVCLRLATGTSSIVLVIIITITPALLLALLALLGKREFGGAEGTNDSINGFQARPVLDVLCDRIAISIGRIPALFRNMSKLAASSTFPVTLPLPLPLSLLFSFRRRAASRLPDMGRAKEGKLARWLDGSNE